MWFNNLTLYQIEIESPEQVLEGVKRQPFTVCGANDASSCGWDVIPGKDEYAVHMNNLIYLRWAVEKKTIPTAGLKAKVVERCKAIEEEQGYYPGRKQQAEIKDNVIAQLLPTTLATKKVIQVIIDIKNKWLMIDASSPTVCDNVINAILRHIKCKLASFATVDNPSVAMTQRLLGADRLMNFDVGNCAETKGNSEQVVKYKNIQLAAREVTETLETRLVTKLQFSVEKLVFTLTDSGDLRALNGELKKELRDHDQTDFNGSLFILSEVLRQTVEMLLEDLGGLATVTEA